MGEWGRLNRVPTPLAALLPAIAVIGVAWALLVPIGQGPDEPAHFSYVEALVERGEAPRPGLGPEWYSTAQRAMLQAGGALVVRESPRIKPAWTTETSAGRAVLERGLPATARMDGGGGRATVWDNPPLYYHALSVPYRLAPGDGYLSRLHFMRLLSGLLLLPAAIGTWLLAGELVGRNRTVQLVAAAAVGLQPLAASVAASVNPDAVLFASWAFALWIMVRISHAGPSAVTVAVLAVAIGIGLLSKTSVSLALVPAAMVAILAGCARARGVEVTSRRSAGLAIGSVGLVAVGALVIANASIPLASWAGGSSGSAGGFASYLWDFYAGDPRSEQLAGVRRFLGVFGRWGSVSEVGLPGVLIAALALGWTAASAVAIRALLRRRTNGPALTVLVLVCLTLVLGLHLMDYRVRGTDGDTILQARYLLPALPAAAAVPATCLVVLSRRTAGLVAGGLLGLFFGVQVLALAITAGRYFA